MNRKPTATEKKILATAKKICEELDIQDPPTTIKERQLVEQAERKCKNFQRFDMVGDFAMPICVSAGTTQVCVKGNNHCISENYGNSAIASIDRLAKVVSKMAKRG